MSYALFTDADDRDAGGWAGAIFGGAAAGGLAAATFGASLAVGGTIASGVGLSGAAGSAVSVGIGGAISGALGGAAGSVIQQSIATGSVDAGQVGADAGYGAAGGAIGAGVGKIISGIAPAVGNGIDDFAKVVFGGGSRAVAAPGFGAISVGITRATTRTLAATTTRQLVAGASSFGSSFAFSVGRRTKQGGRFTEPDLPQKRIAEGRGVRIEHYTRSGDHGPPHVHVKGGGPETRIGKQGVPIEGSPDLTATQQAVVDQNKPLIRKTIDKIQRWWRFENRY